MSNRAFVPSTPRPLPLAACLAAVLGLAASAAHAAPMRPFMPRPQHRVAAPPVAMPFAQIGSVLKPGAKLPVNPAATLHHVKSCNDDPNDPDSLRSIIASMNTVSGDHIDFAQLPMTCSTITLDPANGALAVLQGTLSLDGPGAANLTIDANYGATAFYHYGAGTLSLSGLTIANGQYAGSSHPTGGCIYSEADVFLLESVVTHCEVTSTDVSNPARGGGVYARGNLTFVRSTISHSNAFSTNGAQAVGGGAYVGGLFSSHYSTVNNNWTSAVGGAQNFAGGIMVGGDTDIEGSTISGNRANSVGGIFTGSAATLIANSTISGNVGKAGFGGIATSGGPVTVANSTIAFNRTTGPSNGIGLYLLGGTLTLESSIIAANAGTPGAADLGGLGAQVTGSNNFVTSSALPLPGGSGNIEGICPKLDPLLDNGGYTSTHSLNHASPAVDTGDAGNTTLDQRGAPRPTGIAADIGALEHQPTDHDERILASNFDGFCDF